MSRLAEIYRNEKTEDRGRMSAFSSTIGKGIKESIDPRQLLDQKGLLVSMFPSLKAFDATGSKKEKTPDEKRKVSLEKLDNLTSKQLFKNLLITSEKTLKNTSAMPAAAKDLKSINATLLKILDVAQQGGFGNQSDGQERSMLDSILDSLGLGDLIPDKEGSGKRGRRKGAKDRLKRIQQARAARTAAEAAAAAGASAGAATKPTPAPKPTGKVGKAMSRLNAIPKLGPLVLLLSALNLWSELDTAEEKYDNSQKTDKDLEELKKAYGSAIGGALGGGGGAWAGAAGVGAAAATLGLTLTPLGSLLAGVVGGTAGFFAGDAIGRYAGEKAVSEIFGTKKEPTEPLPLRFNEAEQKELKKALESEDTRKKISPELLKQLDYLANADLSGRRNPMAARLLRDTTGPEAMEKLGNELKAAIARDNPPSAAIPPAMPTPSPTPVTESLGTSTTPTIPAATPMPAAPTPPVSGAAVSSASTAVSDAQLDEARTPIVTAMPATTSTPRPRIEDSAPAGQIASVYNEELMRDIFGKRQQAFA